MKYEDCKVGKRGRNKTSGSLGTIVYKDNAGAVILFDADASYPLSPFAAYWLKPTIEAFFELLIIKKKGWINLFRPTGQPEKITPGGYIFSSSDEAIKYREGRTINWIGDPIEIEYEIEE